MIVSRFDFSVFSSEEEYKNHQEAPENTYIGTSSVKYKNTELRAEAMRYRQAVKRWNAASLKYSLDEMGDIPEGHELLHNTESCLCVSCAIIRQRIEEERIELLKWQDDFSKSVE